MVHRFTRRSILSAMGVAGLSALLAACGGSQATPTPTPQPSPTTPPAQQPSPTARAQTPTSQQPTPSPTAAKQASSLLFPQIPYLGVIGLFVAIEKGFLQDEGIQATFSNQSFPTLGDAIPFISRGDLSGSIGAFGPAIINAVKEGIPVKAVANLAELSQGFFFEAYAASKPLYDAGQVRSLTDARGRRLGTASPFGLVAWEMSKVLASAGVDLSEVELVAMTPPDMVTALANGAVDIGRVSEPFWVIAKRNGAAVALLEGDEIYQAIGRSIQIGLVILSPKLLEDKPLVVGFLRGLKRAVDYYHQAVTDPTGRAELVDILLKYTPRPADITIFDDMIWPGQTSNLRIDTSFITELQEFMLSRGEISDTVNPDAWIDESFLVEALSTV